jgi:hypothetical protein
LFLSAGAVFSMTTVPIAAQDARPAQLARLERYADCVVANAPEFAELGMRENWTGDRFVPALPRRLWNKCDRAGIVVEPITLDLRFEIAWALLRRERIAGSPPDFSAVPPLRTDMPSQAPPVLVRRPQGQSHEQFVAEAKAIHERDLALATIGECVVRARPDMTRAMLVKRDDRTKLDALVETISSCTPSNTRVTFDRRVLGGLLAWIYVRLALAVSPPQAAQ